MNQRIAHFVMAFLNRQVIMGCIGMSLSLRLFILLNLSHILDKSAWMNNHFFPSCVEQYKTSLFSRVSVAKLLYKALPRCRRTNEAATMSKMTTVLQSHLIPSLLCLV